MQDTNEISSCENTNNRRERDTRVEVDSGQEIEATACCQYEARGKEDQIKPRRGWAKLPNE